MPNFHFEWSLRNSKLVKEGTASFNIPALKSAAGFTTCPNASICAGLCYARQGRYTMPNVQGPRERNLWKLREMTDPTNHDNSGWGWLDVQAYLQIDILNLPPRVKQIRIHDSGDFYEPEYMRTWAEVARNCPQYTFYAYTKMISDYLWLRSQGYIPDNLLIVQSVGGKEDYCIDTLLPHSRIFPNLDALLGAGYVNCTHTDRPILDGERNIGLVYHGNKSLKASQSDALLNIKL